MKRNMRLEAVIQGNPQPGRADLLVHVQSRLDSTSQRLFDGVLEAKDRNFDAMTAQGVRHADSSRSSAGPALIDLLIVAHAPPNELDRYFYFADVGTHDLLFREVSWALLKVEPTRETKRDLLEALRDMGVFLVDMALEPISKAPG